MSKVFGSQISDEVSNYLDKNVDNQSVTTEDVYEHLGGERKFRVTFSTFRVKFSRAIRAGEFGDFRCVARIGIVRGAGTRKPAQRQPPKVIEAEEMDSELNLNERDVQNMHAMVSRASAEVTRHSGPSDQEMWMRVLCELSVISTRLCTLQSQIYKGMGVS